MNNMPTSIPTMTTPPVKTAAPVDTVKEKSFLQKWFLEYYRLVTVAACLGLALAGYWLLIGPKIRAVQASVGMVLHGEEAVKQNLEAQLTYLASLAGKRSQFSDADINQITAALPNDPAVPELLASLESIARESSDGIEGVDLSIVEPSKVSGAKALAAATEKDNLPAGVRAVEVSISLSARPYAQVKTLLSNIEKSLRLLDVTSLLYTPTAKAYSITVRSYYQP